MNIPNLDLQNENECWNVMTTQPTWKDSGRTEVLLCGLPVNTNAKIPKFPTALDFLGTTSPRPQHSLVSFPFCRLSDFGKTFATAAFLENNVKVKRCTTLHPMTELWILSQYSLSTPQQTLHQSSPERKTVVL
jgi:hypothetical protein